MIRLPILALVLLGATVAEAQDLPGTLVPLRSVAEPDGVNAILHNPAGVATLRSWELRIYNTQIDIDTPGEGTALLYGMPVIGPLSLGAGIEFVRPPELSTIFRSSLAAAVDLHPLIRLGLVWRYMLADEDPAFDDVHSVDVGMLVRPTSWLSLGFTVRDLNTPLVSAAAVPRRYGLAAAFRPGTDRVTIEVGTEIREDNANTDAIGRLRFQPVEGLEIAGRVGISPREDVIGVDLGVMVGLHFGQAGVEGGAFMLQPPGGDFEYSGFTVGARVSGASYPSLYQRDDRTVTVELSTVGEVPRPGLFSGGSAFTRLAYYLDAIRRDDAVTAVILRDRGTSYGWAQVEELRDRIDELKAAGKDVTAYLEQGDLRHLYLYSAADRIVLNPAGGLMLLGLKSTITYFAEALAKLRIGVQFVKHGKYKTYPEVLERTGPSDAALEVRNSLLDALYDPTLEAIERGRGFDAGRMREIVDQGPYVSQECLELDLVDNVAFWDEIEDVVRRARGRAVNMGRPSFVTRQAREDWGQGPQVAIIPIEGSIIDGQSSRVPLLGTENVGDRTIIAAIKAAIGNPRVVGVVLRVNSPGGSAMASDQMFRAIKKAAEKKPIVVSFSNVAASGGYYLAMGAPTVVAADRTVTGSIGIFTGKPAFGRLFDLLGISRHTVTRGARADLMGIDEPWTEAELKLIAGKLKYFYDLFLQRVHTGRDMPMDEVQEIARGRVWLGSQALARNLVDDRGGVVEAIRRVKERAGMDADDPVGLVFLPEPSLLDKVRNTLGVEVAMLLDRLGHLREALAVAYPFLNGFEPGEALALMPYLITFE